MITTPDCPPRMLDNDIALRTETTGFDCPSFKKPGFWDTRYRVMVRYLAREQFVEPPKIVVPKDGQQGKCLK